MSDIDALVARLRDARASLIRERVTLEPFAGSLYLEAADAITRLQARIFEQDSLLNAVRDQFPFAPMSKPLPEVVSAELVALRERVVKYRARLEIDHHYESVGNTPLIRVDLPFDKDESYDSISCRDETIRLQDEAIVALRAERDKEILIAHEATRLCHIAWDDIAKLKAAPPKEPT